MKKLFSSIAMIAVFLSLLTSRDAIKKAQQKGQKFETDVTALWGQVYQSVRDVKIGNYGA